MSPIRSSENHFNPLPKAVLHWYILIFFSTEIVSYLDLLNTFNILAINLLFLIYIAINYAKPIIVGVRNLKEYFRNHPLVILILFLTFIQGMLSAPNTTDSMTYHIPRVMYWLQEGSSHQGVIRNSHDFIPPFAEYILLHLYVFTNSDRLLFFSQWLAFVVTLILSCLVTKKLGGSEKAIKLVALGVSTIPMAVLQSSSTQVDMVSASLVLMTLYIVLLFIDTPTLKYALYLSFSVGLGLLIKPPFILFVIVPLSLLFLVLFRKPKRTILFGILATLIVALMLSRYFYQNTLLYGNLLGQNLSGSSNTYVNERFDPPAILSNLIKNTMNNIPVPIFNTALYNAIDIFHRAIGMEINDPKTNYDNHVFHVNAVIYPQEDIVGSPLHLILIFIAGFFILKSKNLQKAKLIILYSALISAYILFAIILKWEPYHPRLQIPFVVIGTLIAVIVLDESGKGRFVLKSFTILAVPLALLVVFLNISKPYISYKLFYNNIKQYALPFSSEPVSFYEKTRLEQYFNSRQYWYEPYNQVINDLSKESDKKVLLKLIDEYEYPLWAVARDRGSEFVSQSPSVENPLLIISTSVEPFIDAKYSTKCYKTTINYGYACFSKRIAKNSLNNI